MLKRILLAIVSLALLSTIQPAQAVDPPSANKVIVFVIENRSFTQMQDGAPYIWSMARQYGYAENFKAITHPSLPNYIAMASGSTQGITDNKGPGSHELEADNVFGNSWAAGRSAKLYMDGMFSDRCRQSNTGNYAVRHNPWTYFVDERALCEKYDFDFKYFADDVAAARIPNVGMVIPHNGNNAHDGTLATADNWFKARVATLMAGPDWKAGKLAIVLTADEDNRLEDNRILTVVIHPSQDHNVVTEPLDLYSLHRLLADFGHTAPLLKGATAPDMAAAFGLSID